MREREIERERERARASKRASERAREREREREREKASVRARASEQASERERERTRARERECERKRACYPRPISGTAQPRAQEHRSSAGAMCSAVVTARFLKCVLLSLASHACDHTHTHTHTHTHSKQSKRQVTPPKSDLYFTNSQLVLYKPSSRICRYGEAQAAAASWRAHDGRRQRGTACPHLYRYRLTHTYCSLARLPPTHPFVGGPILQRHFQVQ